MSGHSKWAQIKRQKGAADTKKGAAFTKLANAITIAAREGGKDPSMNFRLRLAIEKAREANMPKDNVDRAIKRGIGEANDRPIEAITYEGYGPGGIAVVVEALTDNRNRTTSELRSTFSKYGGTLANTNSVLWMFERRGFLEVPSNNRDAIELSAIDAGALDFDEINGTLAIYTDPNTLMKVREAIAGIGASVATAEIVLVPTTTVIPNEQDRTKTQELLLALEELQDVTNVSSNAEL
ncbi:MAG: YebC/PmpR family DNA-binding transcriptional regulator [Candidatus Kerfeldbacteria bacterium]